jgi:hypothetical protein
MMDAFMYNHRSGKDECEVATDPGNYYCMELNKEAKTVKFCNLKKDDSVHALFDEGVSPIGYQLQVVEKKDLPDNKLFDGFVAKDVNPLWLVGRLYDYNGSNSDSGNPFFALPVFLSLAPGRGGGGR